MKLCRDKTIQEVLDEAEKQGIDENKLDDLIMTQEFITLKGEFLCKAQRVTSTHPLAYQMGEIKDVEDYKQKIEKQAKLRRKTIKAIKEHFNINDMDLLESELIKDFNKKEEVLTQTNIPIKKALKAPKQQIEPKIKSSIAARPIFKSSYERYEWHMQNGCIGNNDRKWLSEYIKSDEYKEIYS